MKIPKITTDPFLAMVALVVLVPALFFAYNVTHQHIDGRDVKSASTQQQSNVDNSPNDTDSDTTPDRTTQPASITQAERIAPDAKAPLSIPMPAAERPSCDEIARASAVANRDQQLVSENQLHEQQRVKLLLISTIYRKYWDEEVSRHQAALQNIETTYQAALVAANC